MSATQVLVVVMYKSSNLYNVLTTLRIKSIVCPLFDLLVQRFVYADINVNVELKSGYRAARNFCVCDLL